MREIKIFIIGAFIIGIIYYGVEPLAHSAMHPKTAPSDYAFRDLEKFGKIDLSNGNAELGRDGFATNCATCHTINTESRDDFHIRNPKTMQPVGENGGVVPPDLSNAGRIFDAEFLAHFIKDPVRASLLEAKFMVSCEGLSGEEEYKCNMSNEGKEIYPMQAFNGLLSDEEIANIVAYLKSIAPQHISDKEVFIEACNRCHAVQYDKNQYDSKFFSIHNAKVQDLLNKAEKESEYDFLSSLDSENTAFLQLLLSMQKAKEKAKLTESEIDEQNDMINAKTIQDYGVVTLLQQSLKESEFNPNGLQAATQPAFIKAYLGNNPPDLSMMIRAKGHHELSAFINNPQKIPLDDIKKAIINKLVQEKQQAEKDALPQDLTEEDRKARMKAIELKDANEYGIKLPENTTKSPWQNDDDYTNMAREMGVMPFGKSMPRVGLTKEAEEQIINYLETIGDSKKTQRDSLGTWIIGFFIILSIIAYLWKSKIWKDLH